MNANYTPLFKVEDECDKLKAHMFEWFSSKGFKKAIVGVSGGADSTVCCKLACDVLGPSNVFAVRMPNGTQADICDANKVIEICDCNEMTLNIGEMFSAMNTQFTKAGFNLNDAYKSNSPARLRMSMLFGLSALVGAAVINTCNLSEDWVGYSTRYGDSAGDVSLLGRLTVQEVKALGHELGLPEKLVEKTPSDGLCGSTDEQKLGFTYAVLDRYIRDGVCENESVRRHIDTLHKQNKFKLELIPTFEP